MSHELIQSLQVSVNITELREYYHTIENDYPNLKWSWDQRDTIVKQWVDAAMQDPANLLTCLLYTSPSPRDRQKSRMPSSA